MNGARNARSVTVIPANEVSFQGIDQFKTRKKKVAAYARVSTDHAEQLTSFEAQRDYYTKLIKANGEWDFVEVYTDEGISATSTKRRDGFNRMVQDGLAGKIDLIITKSVSRFARNTVDSLTTVRQLKEKGVEIFFEKENIYTMDSKGELMLTILSSLTQEESRNLSSNIAWGRRKQFADGKVSLPYKHFLGYEKGEDGLPKIIESEAVIIREIYKLFLEGQTPSKIAKILTEREIKSPAGKEKWHTSTVISILRNEKYFGAARLQKSLTIDFLSKKRKQNEGEVPQYYIEKSHPAIIKPEVFELVQEEFRRREKTKGYTSAINCFANRITCGDCGGFYGRKVWHAGDKYAHTVWQCNHKYSKKTNCSTPHLKESVLKEAFVEVFNQQITNKKAILKNYDAMLIKLMDFVNEEKEKQSLLEECEGLKTSLDRLIAENSRKALDQTEYHERYIPMASRYNALQEKIQEIDRTITMKKARYSQMKICIKTLAEKNTLIQEFDESLWCTLIETVIVESLEELVFVFKDQTKVSWLKGEGKDATGK